MSPRSAFSISAVKFHDLIKEGLFVEERDAFSGRFLSRCPGSRPRKTAIIELRKHVGNIDEPRNLVELGNASLRTLMVERKIEGLAEFSPFRREDASN